MSKFTGVAKDDPTFTSTQLKGSGSTRILAQGDISTTITPASVAAATCAEQTFTVVGLKVGDSIAVSPPSITAGVAPVCARVSATDTVAITFMNATAGALVPAAGAYRLHFSRS